MMNKLVSGLLICLVCGPSAAHAFSILSESSMYWWPVPGNYDYVNDHQTGQSAGDIVGTATDPGFFTSFIALSPDNRHLAFRVRLDAPGGTKNNPVFDRFLWVGIDANLNGAIDVFLGVNRQGNNNLLQVYAPGNNLNT